MTEMTSRPGLIAGATLAGCLLAQAGCAPTPPPFTRTVSTEQVTMTTPLPPPPQMTTTTTTEDAAPSDNFDSGSRLATAHHSWSRDNDDVDEESETTIVPTVPAQPQTTTRTTTQTQQFQQH